MSFVLEDGTGKKDSTSYVSVADADAYHTLYGNSDWVGQQSEKELALIHATKACDLLYGQRYISLPQYSEQALLFPRFTMVLNKRQIIQTGTLPRQLKDAICELALAYMQGMNIYPTPNLKAQTSSETVKVGDVEVQTSYGHTPQVEKFQGLWKVEMILAPILMKDGSANNAGIMGF